jgi:ligand-binding SRPBCC domain-containing protein
MASRLEFEQWVPFRIERVFAFFSNPDNLPNLMPAASRTKLTAIHRTPSPPVLHLATEKAAGVGSTIVTSFRAVPFLPFRAHWIARITEFEWNHYFADVQDEGPFRSWHHRHEFIVQERDGVMGTLVRDVIDYEIGFSFVGASVNALFVRHQIERTFAERQKTLPKLLG